MRSTQLDHRKVTGSHYTPNLLAGFVAKQIVRAMDTPLNTATLRVLDPGVGDGELLICLAERLLEIGFFEFDIFGFDTHQGATNLARARLKERFPDLKSQLDCKDFVSVALSYYSAGDNKTIFNPISPEQYDLVIANPPYVRTQVMGAKKAQQLASQFGLTGRVDLYYAFLLGIAKVLRPGGILGIIVSNRFMTTRAGSSVRENVLRFYDVLHVWDLGDTKLFEAAVLPAVLLLRRKNCQKPSVRPKFTSIYTTSDKGNGTRCSDTIAALEADGIVRGPRTWRCS
jgi:type I restriction-modification system DNA methylase subunit